MIVTVRLLAWATLTLLSAMAMLASLTTPQWIVGPPTRIGLKLSRKNQSFINQDPMHSAAGTLPYLIAISYVVIDVQVELDNELTGS